MAEKQTYFNPSWMISNEFFWLRPVDKDRTMAACSLCKNFNGSAKTFALSCMGVKALRSHADGAKHRENAKAYKIARSNPLELHLTHSDKSTPGQNSTGRPKSTHELSNTILIVSKYYFIKELWKSLVL